MIHAQSFFNDMLKDYVRIDSDTTINAVHTFLKTIESISQDMSVDVIPNQDKECKVISFKGNDSKEIGYISFIKTSNANTGITFGLGEYTFTLKISDEGHIDLRSSYPLSGFTTGTDEVATTEYVIDCSKYNDEILEASLKKFIEASLEALETSMKGYTDNAVSALETSLKAYIDGIATTLRGEIDSLKNWVRTYVKNEIEKIDTDFPTLIPKIGKYDILNSEEDQIGDYEFSSGGKTGFLMLFTHGNSSVKFSINDKVITEEFTQNDKYGRRERPALIPIAPNNKYTFTNIHGPVIFFPLELEVYKED